MSSNLERYVFLVQNINIQGRLVRLTCRHRSPIPIDLLPPGQIVRNGKSPNNKVRHETETHLPETNCPRGHQHR
jgi:hypothetical protein